MKKFYIPLVILTLFSNYIYSVSASDPADWMPDANLRTAVRASLGLADNEALTQAKMLDLTELKAAGRGISNITGLEHATNATTLRLANNQISNLNSLSGLTSVTKLRLQNNDITSCTALSGLTNLTELFLYSNQITNVTPLASLTNLVTLRLAGNQITDFSPLSGLSKLSDVDVTIPEPDTTSPGVSISVPSGVQNGAFSVTITFTETVSGFVQSDVSLSGSAASITSWSANSDDTVYTATITPTASGTVTVGVAANIATDAANNQNTAATSQTVTVDVDAPTVTIDVPSGVQNGAFSVTITFTEVVSGFGQSDLSLSGTASASITAWNATNNTTYTATITPTSSGSVTFSIAAGVATDTANNQNTAATSQSVTVTILDTTSPGVSAGASGPADWMPDANLRTTVRTSLGLADNEALTQAKMLDLTELKAAGRGISNITGLEHATNATTLRLANNQISNLNSLSGLTSVTKLRLQNNDITSCTALSGLTNLTELFLYSNQITNVTPLASLTNLVTLRLAGNQITDFSPLSGLSKLSDVDVTIPEPDTTSPGVSISVPSGVQNGAFSVTITFTETVSGFVQSDVSLSGSAASITSWSANSDDTVYTATITPTASGTVTVGVAANIATDAANNQNTAATSQTVTVDVDAPTVTIDVPSGVQNGAFSVTITFAETVSGFAQSDVSLSGSAASITSWSANSDNTVYTATITPTASGTVTIDVAANVATDAANNQNTAATSQSVIVTILDTTQPGVTISVATEHATMTTTTVSGSVDVNGPFKITITFTESVSNFEQSDILLERGRAEISNFSASDTKTYTADVTPELDEDNRYIRFVIPSGAATDAAGNPNREAEYGNAYIDMERPNVYITAPTSNVTTETFTVTIKFAEHSYWDAQEPFGFDQSDLSLINNTAGATVTGWSLGTDHITTATITVTQSGSVTFRVAEGIATDSANNNNTASLLKTVAVTHPNAAPSANGSVPDQTLLQPNYPNPFNPETWIPYHLANDSDVQISIYDINGALVRQLDLGYQQAGYYTNRSRAAYWDGRNEFGERVATGIYFYQLRADNMSLIRKMVILK